MFNIIMDSVWFEVGFGDSGRVFVDGLANAGTLKAEIERKNNEACHHPGLRRL